MFVHAKDLLIAAIGGGGHDEKEGAPAGGGWGACQPGPLAERIGNVELNPLRSALLCRPYVGPNASLVARPPPADLFICAKYLFVAAKGQADRQRLVVLVAVEQVERKLGWPPLGVII